jgi:ribosomal protein S26
MSLDIRCVICGEPVPEERAKRGAITCGQDCSRELNKRRRSQKAGSSCRLCGRRVRKPRAERVLTEQGAVESRPSAEAAHMES